VQLAQLLWKLNQAPAVSQVQHTQLLALDDAFWQADQSAAAF
jgi:hypothetical protein